MPYKDDIQILIAGDIDRKKWDACVRADPDALIYSCSWFLDRMAPSWLGIVVNDYETIVALPLKSRFGINMIYLPPFVQRLGIAGKPLPEEALERIRKIAAGRARLIQYASSEEHLFIKGIRKERTNFIIRLDRPYPSVSEKYTPLCKKNLRQAAGRGCILVADISIDEVIAFYTAAYAAAFSYKKKHFDSLRSMLEYALKNGFCHVHGVKDARGQLVYAGLLLDDGKRLYYLLGAPNPEGRKIRATYFFIDAMIREHAGSGRTFDFEGSDIPSVAAFYSSFSPVTEHYFQFYINRLPFPLNRLIDRRL